MTAATPSDGTRKMRNVRCEMPPPTQEVLWSWGPEGVWPQDQVPEAPVRTSGPHEPGLSPFTFHLSPFAFRLSPLAGREVGHA